MSRQAVEFPRHVDDPPTLLLWRMDDLVPVMSMVIIGILLNQLTLFAVLGLVLVRFYGRYRDSRPDGYVLHWAYWLGVLPATARTCPNPYIRRWLP
jgi:conjugal transfer pilus assembly protein TraL